MHWHIDHNLSTSQAVPVLSRAILCSYFTMYVLLYMQVYESTHLSLMHDFSWVSMFTGIKHNVKCGARWHTN